MYKTYKEVFDYALSLEVSLDRRFIDSLEEIKKICLINIKKYGNFYATKNSDDAYSRLKLYSNLSKGDGQ